MSVELLSPAGNFEKLKAAINFGADAVYFSGKDFGLRAKAGNFSLYEMEEALKYLHERGKKGYVTVNIYARNYDFEELKRYLHQLNEIKLDGIIISDLGVLKLIKDEKIDLPVHISTQANTTNYYAVNMWKKLGASRVVLARELSKSEIEYICKNCDMEIEVFVHGAMCISHSGRCVLSNYMTGRDANRGECTHPCRWNYYLMEETREGEYFPIFEDERGTYIYNSKDLCLLKYVKELMDMGVHSLKIEGRMKSVMYVSVVTGVYRKVIDDLKNGKEPDYDYLMNLLMSVSNREYTTGFYLGNADRDSMNYKTSSYVRNTDFLGVVNNYKDGKLFFDSRGKILANEALSILNRNMKEETIVFDKIFDVDGNLVEFTKPNKEYYILTDKAFGSGSIIRRYKV
ncbi:peptidase, U32 family [Deferribacter desulfuricans SSM1]|uniref:Peptidase, U32 family n=1 Tax=Deferribacter desulfuricans (strain DSM 14783 / JCM 11476 / NBRC 101012 / SSM1) TaxID=639282 RepID=D3PBQ0_DEFDS|nr:U32 family peptidase [Deferribacter desulfuricans]BAI80023.1 peptidase, U32 family [Deferribacter desulfuricans SSM1]